MSRRIDVNPEFLICRYHNGIKLISRENAWLSQKSGISFKSINSVAEMMSMPFNVFFLSHNFEVQEINEIACETSGFVSRADALGCAGTKTATNRAHAVKIQTNSQYVMTTNQLAVFNEKADLKDNRNIHAISFKMPWYDKTGKIMGVFGCAAVLRQNELNAISHNFSVISNMFLPSFPIKDLPATQEINGKHFSPREIDVIRWMVRGKTMREIGLLLNISFRTVESYFNNIKLKAGVKTKSELIAFAYDYFNAHPV